MVLPQKMNKLTEEERQVRSFLTASTDFNLKLHFQLNLQHIMSLEHSMMYEETLIPVYFASWNAELHSILSSLASGSSTSPEKSTVVAEALTHSLSATGYQIVVSSSQPRPKPDIKVATIYGKLSGTGSDEKLPTIAIVAHYDSAGVTPELAFGADSNASGVSMLLEIARLFSILYSAPKARPRHNLVFILTGAGKLNYQGSKKWLEDQLDGIEGSVIQVRCIYKLTIFFFKKTFD